MLRGMQARACLERSGEQPALISSAEEISPRSLSGLAPSDEEGDSGDSGVDDGSSPLRSRACSSRADSPPGTHCASPLPLAPRLPPRRPPACSAGTIWFRFDAPLLPLLSPAARAGLPSVNATRPLPAPRCCPRKPCGVRP